jgi:undecaprenyl-diphosphatase
VHSLSFPSGHAMVSAAVYLSLAVLVSRALRQRAARAYVLAAGVTITLLVGITRVYFGVHYPTDVLAGWLAGASWALLCGLVALALQRRGAVEKPGQEPDAPL